MSAKKKIVDVVKKIVMPILNELSYELVDIEFKKEGSNWFLRVFIDKPNGITIDDCQIVSEKISKKLDEIDPIPHSYFLEVSSPGIDRPLKSDRDLKKHLNEVVEIKTFEPINGTKKIEGYLRSFNEKQIEIYTLEKDFITIPRDKISTIKLAVKIF